MMKKYIKYMASLLAVSFAMSACIDLEEMNVDPNNCLLYTSPFPYLYGYTAPMGRGGSRHSAGAAHLEQSFLDTRLPPLDAGNGRPVGRTHGPLRQCSGPYVGAVSYTHLMCGANIGDKI